MAHKNQRFSLDVDCSKAYTPMSTANDNDTTLPKRKKKTTGKSGKKNKITSTNSGSENEKPSWQIRCNICDWIMTFETVCDINAYYFFYFIVAGASVVSVRCKPMYTCMRHIRNSLFSESSSKFDRPASTDAAAATAPSLQLRFEASAACFCQTYTALVKRVCSTALCLQCIFIIYYSNGGIMYLNGSVHTIYVCESVILNKPIDLTPATPIRFRCKTRGNLPRINTFAQCHWNLWHYCTVKCGH